MDAPNLSGQADREHHRASELRRYYRWMILIFVLIAAGVGLAARAFGGFLFAFGLEAGVLAIYAAFADSVLVPRTVGSRPRQQIVALVSTGLILELVALGLAAANDSARLTALIGLAFILAGSCVGGRFLTT